MIDFALSRCKGLPASIACLGLLYSKADGTIGQGRAGHSKLNLIDLSLLPLTPIMGDGSAPLQPQEVCDASDRLAFLALTDPAKRPAGPTDSPCSRKENISNIKHAAADGFRYYDAVGPETITMLDMLRKFAHFQGNHNFRPVYIGYRNMENMLNVKSLGNLNRQFVSLLRSEQDAAKPVIGDPSVWGKLLGDDAHMLSLDMAFAQNEEGLKCHQYRSFPFASVLQHVIRNPKVIVPGIQISGEIVRSYLKGNPSERNKKPL